MLRSHKRMLPVKRLDLRILFSQHIKQRNRRIVQRVQLFKVGAQHLSQLQ